MGSSTHDNKQLLCSKKCWRWQAKLCPAKRQQRKAVSLPTIACCSGIIQPARLNSYLHLLSDFLSLSFLELEWGKRIAGIASVAPYEPCHGPPDSQPAPPRLLRGCGSQSPSSLSAGELLPPGTLQLKKKQRYIRKQPEKKSKWRDLKQAKWNVSLVKLG